MIRFNCDYGEGAHESILQRLAETNLEQTAGYGEDRHCQRAAELIRQACQAPDVAVHFLVGGTQANLTVIAAALRSHQCVLAADTGHINVHETGAIESCGHKVMTLPARDGKLTADQIKSAYDAHYQDETHEHMTQPKMVYISHPTELGTLYSRDELKEISEVCQTRGLLLFLDGARLGYGLCAQGSDVDLPFLAEYCDVFYIGGTKQGALFGEAVVIRNQDLKEDFRYLMKQKGGMLAKGRLLGIQFEVLFENGLYFTMAKHADKLAMKLKNALLGLGYPMLLDSVTNQQFFILPDALLKELSKEYAYAYWSRVDETHSAIRLCTSWATKEEQLDKLIAEIAALTKA